MSRTGRAVTYYPTMILPAPSSKLYSGTSRFSYRVKQDEWKVSRGRQCGKEGDEGLLVQVPS